MQTLLKFFLKTPIYVYIIFLYLVIVGLGASRDRVISLYKAIIILGVFSYLSLAALAKLDMSNGYHFSFLFVLVLSSYFGWMQLAKKKIPVDRKKMLFAVPGSWITMILVLIIFFTKYYFGYRNFQDPSFKFSYEAKLLTIFTSGFSLGVIIGRFVHLVYRFNISKHTDLTNKAI